MNMESRILGKDLMVSAVCPVTVIQNRYSMMYRDYEKLFPTLEELGVGFVAFSPMANGLLTGRYTADSKFSQDDYRSVMPQFSSSAIDENRELLELLQPGIRSTNILL